MRSRIVGYVTLGVLLATTAALAGCSSKEADEPDWAPPGVDGEPEGLVVTPPRLPQSRTTPSTSPAKNAAPEEKITLPNGGEVFVQRVDGQVFVPVEMTFSERSWQAIQGKAGFEGKSAEERKAVVTDEMRTILSAVSKSTRIVNAEIYASVGWATALVPYDQYEGLAAVKGIGRRLLVNPVVSTPLDVVERSIKTDEEMGFAASGGSASLEDLVGLSRMGVKEFLAEAAADLDGYVPNGSHVTVGVVDTGISYNHPAFTDVEGKPRIDLMRDYTGEGRIFFSAPEAARFIVAPAEAPPPGARPEEAFKVTADFLVAPMGNREDPNPTALEKVENEVILVGPELRAALVAEGASGARFGVFDEVSFGSKTRSIDIDHNGRMDDRFYAILVPGKDGQPDAIWVAIGGTGKGDFRKAPKLHSFEVAHETQTSFAEKFGWEIKKEKLLAADGSDVPVTTAAIVGFDPGSHGSHVAGISAARKMLSNHGDDTEVRGVAPLARLAIGRICARTGGCRGTKAIVELSSAGADVINMSIGSLGPTNDGYGVQETIIDRLSVINGTTFVIAASNDGPGRQTVGSPSVARYGIAVGATASPAIIQAQYHYPGSGKVPESDPNADDYIMYFSSRGPTAAGGMKPDISAPGTWLSAVQLNASPGDASGLDVMWGTSMASPAAAGAVALLLDAAKVYNAAHPQTPLATDAPTIKRVFLASARPFDVTTLDTKTGETRKGQYTWVDEGFGMVNVQRAWQLLKAERGVRIPAPVSYRDDAGRKVDVPLDYQVRIVRKNPNGQAYDGTVTVETTPGETPEAKFARGLWIDAKNNDSMFRVQVARRLPSSVVGRPDVGELAVQLQTTADEFELETTVHGSHLNWVRVGGHAGVDCTVDPTITPGAPLPRLLVVGEGTSDLAINPSTGAGGTSAQSTSVLSVCVNRALVEQLPPGDHGAVVTAYRVTGNKREAVPSFVVPVYVTVPEKTMAAASALHVSSTVGSFGVGRHYVDIPKGTSVVKVNLAVPPPLVAGTVVTGCGGVMLEAHEGGNTATPPEFIKAPSDRIAQSCGTNGRPALPEYHSTGWTRSNPTPGIWDLHVFGFYGFVNSAYTLDVTFANVEATKKIIEGQPSALSTSFDVNVLDASFQLELSAEKSVFQLGSFVQDVTAQVAQDQKLQVPNGEGKAARSYPEDITSVTISTSGSPGNDIDLTILECADEAGTACARAASSGTPTDVESATFAPKPGKFYVAEVLGYKIAADPKFSLREETFVKAPNTGSVAIAAASQTKFGVTTSFDVAASSLLADARYTSGAYLVGGFVDVKDSSAASIVRVPVLIRR